MTKSTKKYSKDISEIINSGRETKRPLIDRGSEFDSMAIKGDDGSYYIVSTGGKKRISREEFNAI